MRGRPTVTTYVYDDQGRVARTITASSWTPEDRALMLARKVYRELELCPGCGHPKRTAWHEDNDGWFEENVRVTCHACTAMRSPDADGKVHPVEYVDVVDTRDYDENPLPDLMPDGAPGDGAAVAPTHADVPKGEASL